MEYSKGNPLNGEGQRESYDDYMRRRMKEEYPVDLFNNKAQKHEEAEAREKHPLNTLQQLMIITAEECGELTQMCSKTVRKFNTIEEANSKLLNATTNRQKLIEEAGDVYCMLKLMEEHGMFTMADLEDRAEVKRNKLKRWSNLINET
jgi:NTP pyrophosphatase (non-canonical NTP hydrolase)